MVKQFSVLLVGCFLAAGVAAQEKFRIMGDPSVGSKVRPIEVESYIPFNKPYDQLSDAQKTVFRANYGVLKETEHPPFPTKGLQTIYKPLIKGHEKVSRGGTLFLVAMIDEKGAVENVSVYESPTNSMTELANAVLFNTEFDPAICDGKPCKMEFPFEFKLRSKEKIISN